MNEKISVQTPHGPITATVSSDPLYPGIFIDYGDDQVALVEYTSNEQKSVLRVWDQDIISQGSDPVYEKPLYPRRQMNWEYFADLYQLSSDASATISVIWQALQRQGEEPEAISENDHDIINSIQDHHAYATVREVLMAGDRRLFILLRSDLKK